MSDIVAVFGGVFVSGLALGEERRAGLAGKKTSRLWSSSQASVARRINQITEKFSSARGVVALSGE
jgi:hypothetical protein